MASWLFSSLQTLSGKLVDVIRGSDGQEQNETKSIEEDLKWLSRMLQRIEAVQQDAEEREIHDKSVALWLRELRGVAHQAEDVLDEYHYEVLKSIVENRNTATETPVDNTDNMMVTSSIGTKGNHEGISTSSSHASSSCSVFKIIAPDGLADAIKNIRKLFEEICKDRVYLHMTTDDGLKISGPLCRLPTSSHIDEKGLFGRENEKEKIISLLNVENNVDFMVVPIVGKGGLGKTTLAQLVYNDPKVCQLFDKKAWVSVSEDFDLVRLTKATIESIINKPCEFSELNKLQDNLKKELNGIKLFLVLDDIWNEKKTLWESFKIVFTGVKTVRILITTRNQAVAKIMQTTSPFELAQLHEDKCWMLFKHSVFGNQDENEHADLLKIGRLIVKKCNGLPLAVKVLGGLLQYETSEVEWEDVLENDTWIVDEKEEIMPILSLSYYHMPLYLRPCFLYLSMFPKDNWFKKEEVIRLWMAQGYINSRPNKIWSNKTLEDIGGKYFEELQCRSLIDSLHQGTYILHDLIHDLARSINEKIYPTPTNNKLSDDPFHVHHIYLNRQKELLNYITTNNVESIRTLWGYKLDAISIAPVIGSDNILADSSSSDDDQIDSSDDDQIDSSIIFFIVSLRVLKLEAYISALPGDIGKLKHLCYLSISGGYWEYLPRELCVLYNLQTLDANCPSLCELPSNIGNLINLRYLRLYSYKVKKLPDSISNLRNLQLLELDAFRMDVLSSGIEQRTNLRRLNRSYSYSGIEMPRGLGKLTQLQNIEGTLNFKGDAMQGGLGEFKLRDLRGSLWIDGIENITDVEYTRVANIKSKSNLERLGLNFSDHIDSSSNNFDGPTLYLIINKPISMEHSTSMKDIQESVLDSLQPHDNIKDVKILNYGGTKWPSWISDPLQMSKLTHLCVIYGYKCMCLPSLGRLPSLKFLDINGLGVEKIGNEFCRESDSSLNNAFPSLEKLVFSGMSKWEDWIGMLDGDFPCLIELSINWCPNLRKLPTLGRLPSLKFLNLSGLGVEKIRNEFCRESDSSSNNAFPSLEKLVFSDMPKWEDWIGVLDGDFSCLIELSIEECPNLRKLPTLGRLPSLKFLDIGDLGVEKIGNEFCRESDSSSNNAFPSLAKLVFSYMPKWEDWIGVLDGDFPCLIELSIEECPNLRKLPTLGRLPSLKFLNLSGLGVEKIRNEFCRESDSSSNNAFPSLEKLVFSDMPKWEDWIGVLDGDFPCLIELSIEECPNLRKLPTLGRLPSLKFLNLSGLGVEKIRNEFCRESDSSSNNAFPSLEKLFFFNMPKWQDWIGVLDGDFPCLIELSIEECPKLRKIPTITNELEKLEIYECGFHEIQLPVSLYVKIVKISYCRELTLVMGLNNYKSLTELTIEHCPLLTLSMDSFLLSMIPEVKIGYCAKLDIPGLENIDYYQKNATDKWFRADSDNVQFPLSASSLVCTNEALGTHLHEGMTSQKCVMLDLPILEEVEIGKYTGSRHIYYLEGNYCYLTRLFILGLPKLRRCKGDFMPVTVEYLEVSRCHKLITIPPFGENSALREIRISGCPKLSVIEGLHLLSSLKTLILEDCLELRVLPCEKLKIGIQTVRISNCPLTMDWCQLNGFPENKEIRFLTDGEGSSIMVHIERAYLTDGIGASIMAESAKADVEEDLDTSLHL